MSAAAPIHPGTYVREVVLEPKNLPVTKAAELVGVGRPAFSNFLNGKASVTPEMAARIEVAFGLPASDLLARQAAFDAAVASPADAAVSAKRYVVALLEFKANDFENWVTNNVGARTRLAVLLRTLVNSTAEPTKSDFPGNDDAERPGWDGWSECESGNPWVPAGRAGWEFGTNKEPGDKANDDYAKSVKAMPAAERAETTFVFVTPRRWPGKTAWLKKKRAEKNWKDVRAYDATDLEQWTAQSVPAQAWLASELSLPTQEVASLDDAWREWTGAVRATMPASLFDTAVAGAKARFTQWLRAAPEKPFVVAADSKEEALAFLSALLPEEDAQTAGARDRVVIFKAPSALAKLAKGALDFIAVATTDDVQRELAAVAKQVHAIAVLPRNATGVEADVALEPLTSDDFRVALEGAGYKQDEIYRLARESGRSLTVLRRRLSDLPAVKTPPWAQDKGAAVSLIALYLAGSWNSKNEKDTAAVARIAGLASAEELEQRVQELAALPQAPVWSVATHRGVFSKIDVMFATAGFVTRSVLERFFEQARVILEEDDPKLDLPEDKRWAAAIYNKSREFSESLRDGVAESLVLLAVHGDALFGDRIGFRCNEQVESFVRRLMEPLTARRLEAAGSDLLAYAEAAPDVFLRVLERDLDQAQPQTHELLRPAGTTFGGCPRSDLLWALEGLAWNPKTLGRTALLLAKLARVEIRDNWSNKPISSLLAIFRPWMPQTAAAHDERLRALRFVVDKAPDVGWRLAIGLLDPRDQIGSPSHKPRWRNDGYGHGEPIEFLEPIWKFRGEVAELVLAWRDPYTAEMICGLIELLAGLSQEHGNRLWALVGEWAKTASDRDKADVREKVRVSVLSKRVAKRIKREDWPAMTKSGQAAFKLLEPADAVFKHAWLFKQSWVPDSADDLFGEHDFEARERHVLQLRTAGLREVFATKALGGLRELAEQGAGAEVVGAISATEILSFEQLHDFARQCATREPLDFVSKGLMAGFMRAPEETRTKLLQGLRAVLNDGQYLELLLRAPFTSHSWTLVERLAPELQHSYWSAVMPWHAAKDDLREAVRQLTGVGRPRAAFSVGQHQLDALGPAIVYDLLIQIAEAKQEEPGDYKLDPHWLREAFSLLESAPQLSLQQKAILEFVYIDALWTRVSSTDKHYIPNLERFIEVNPDFYIQALVWAFRRSDGQEDPPELKAGEGSKKVLAERSYKLLDILAKLPAGGTEDKPSLENLRKWLDYVRAKAEELGRLKVADSCLGKLLACEPPAADGVWPGQLARDALEQIRSDEMARGMGIARRNSRGVVTRARGGVQERELAARYERWAVALQYSHPYVSTEVLEPLARSYESDAKREDDDEMLRDRLET